MQRLGTGPGDARQGSSLIDDEMIDIEEDSRRAKAAPRYLPSQGQPTFRCACGAIINTKQQLAEHTLACVNMQRDGFASFAQFLGGLLTKQIGDDQVKIENLRAIFDMHVPPKNAQPPLPNGYPPISEKDEVMVDPQNDKDMFMGYREPGEEKKEKEEPEPGQKVDASAMDGFMAPAERQRAQTFYEQLQREREDSLCRFCDKVILDIDMQNNNMTMLQSTDCWHQVHVDCLREMAIQKLSCYEDLACPRCGAIISTAEVMEILSPEDKAEIEKAQTMQIVKNNPDLVQCTCGNIMEMLPGDVVYGQKDDRGQPLSQEAAQHMARYRIRCNECSKNFCTNCNAEPYHTGKTCDQLGNTECRFCGEELKQPSPSMKPAFKNVCRKQECFALMQQSCDKLLPCGHPCHGLKDEKTCLPCLEPECIEKVPEGQRLKCNKDDFCPICFCSGIGQEPSVRLDCGHVMHFNCVKTQVQKQWNGPRVVFNYLQCPECKQKLSAKSCPPLQTILDKENAFEERIVKMAMERAKFEDLHKDPRLKKQGDAFFNDLQGFALKKLSYYQCFKCQNPYFGGMKDCDAAQNDYQNFKKEELVCGKCAAVAVGGGVKDCKTHGQDFIEFKCKFCCSVAQWFCWGNTHFCEPCHKKQCGGDYVSRKPRDQLPKCPGKAKCPLKVDHPPNGEEYALGCSVCRNLQTNHKEF